jgi:hypothetical protein
MKSMVKVLLGVVAGALVLAVATPPAEAQCATGARPFATIGGAGVDNKFRLNPAGTHGVIGTEFGRFWACHNSNEGNNFIVGDPQRKMGPGCPSTGGGQANGGWWQVAQTTLRGIEGFMTGTGCLASSCPDNDLCLVVEDWGAGGPPGVGGTAFFVGFRTLWTPGAGGGGRYWDFSRHCGAAVTSAQCEANMNEFPVPKITSATKQGVNRALVTDSNVDPSVNVYVHRPNAGPASDLIASYDLLVHTGTSDPGRNRNATGCAPPNPGGNCWNLLSQISYSNAAVSGEPVVVSCDNIPEDAFIAFGMSFVGGPPGGPVPSQLVGRAIQVECGGDIAEPDPRPKKGSRVDTRPSRTTDRPKSVR